MIGDHCDIHSFNIVSIPTNDFGVFVPGPVSVPHGDREKNGKTYRSFGSSKKLRTIYTC